MGHWQAPARKEVVLDIDNEQRISRLQLGDLRD
jgi:hypothetical protein